MGERRAIAALAMVIGCLVATGAAPARATAQSICAAPRALAAERQLAAAQASYERLLELEDPPACAGSELADVLASRERARRLLRDGRAAEKSDRRKAFGLYRRALSIDASLTAASDALTSPRPQADERTLHDVGDDLGAWAKRRGSDLANALQAVGVVLGTLALVFAVLLLLGAVLLRIWPIKRSVRRAAWNLRRMSLLAAGRRKRYLVGIARWILKPLAWGTATPLRVEQPKDGAKGADAMRAIAGLLPTVTTRGTGGVDFVVSPFAAKTALEEVTDVFAGVPQGKVAAAVIKLARRALPRDTLNVSGVGLDSPQRGAGLALSLVDAAGNSIASRVLWASDFDPYAEPGAEEEAEGDRLLRLAWGGAIWAEFAALRHHRALGGDDDWRRYLGTRDWMSYALAQIAVYGRNDRSSLVTQAAYARALDRDPHNLHALSNLARIDLERGDNVQSLRRFSTVLNELEVRESGRDLPERDPVRYHAAYGRAVANLEIDDRADRLRRTRDELTPHMLDLERALDKLDCKNKGRDAVELRGLLRSLEGPLLALWAYLDARLAAKERDQQQPERRTEPLPTATAEPLGRKELIARLGGGTLGHATLVRNFVLEHVDIGPRTQYNLASYYTATKHVRKAREALEAGLELGTLTDSAIGDRQLRPLRRADRRKFDKLIDIYRAAEASGLAAIAAIGTELGPRLEAMGLDSGEKVVAAAGTPETCAELAARLDVGPSLVERWVRLLRMQQHVRIETRHLNLLDAADVDSLGALSRVTAERLSDLLKGVDAGDDLPRTATLQRWIEAAAAA